ncbi:MAG: 30S ribosomal protein S20 [Planctomycetes bacterium]|jgi:small subunit ribosomal protein S20|nr:30S ribosomal protein S20 [Planctomycetota bacterium]HNZ66924.1 30S ribosomal protein S20 [Planctomycetota bacterium]HON44387.1 30S ribosomal protein S20 [Planctomycetota bacterium]HPY75330.1 30S ribosomal protein S20 [Planctomycetota bacterium]HQA99713.1 30S ribosomal protein S20 [Planctomycetota bacterium]
MPNLKSAKKRTRQNEKKRLHNRTLKSAMRTQVKKFLACMKEDSIEDVKKTLDKTVSVLDKVGKKGILHKNNISRKKSALYKAYNQLVATKAAEAIIEESK